MACGRERSVSIFTLLHLVFHRHKPVEDGIKGNKENGGEKHIPKKHFIFIHVFCKPELFWCDMVESHMGATVYTCVC